MANKNRWFWLELGVFGLKLQLEFTDVYEMMHKGWSNIEEVAYIVSQGHPSSFKVTRQKIADFDPNRMAWQWAEI